MNYGYANGGDKKMSVSTQIEIIRTRFPKLKVGTDAKGGDEEFEAFFEKEKFLMRGTGHNVVVAQFHHLATSRDQLADRASRIHARGSFIVEAESGLSTEDRSVCSKMMVDSIYIYETGLSPKQRSELAANAAKSSPRSTAKPGRMPHKEAQVYLCDMRYTVPEAVSVINSVRDAKGAKKYRVPWTQEFAYREKREKRIDFPTRAPGRRPIT